MLTIVGCARQQPTINLDYLECREAQGSGYPTGLTELRVCNGGPTDDDVAFACTWDSETRAKAYGTAPEFNYAARNSNCTFTNENRSRARCVFEYIATPWADYGAQRNAVGEWRESSVDITYFVSTAHDGEGHFGEQFYWIADFSCRDKTK